MSFSLVHTFHDGTNEPASGAAVNDNFEQLKTHIEALEAAMTAQLGVQRLQSGKATILAAALGVGVSTQTIALPVAWPTEHTGFWVAIKGAVSNAAILLRASGVESLAKGFFVPDMGGTNQNLEISWVSVGH